MKRKFFLAVVCASFSLNPLRAEEIIGVQSGSNTPTSAETLSEEAETESIKDEEPRRETERQFEEERSESASSGRGRGDISLSGRIGAGQGLFYSSITVGYGLNPYMGLEFTGFYSRYNRDKEFMQAYGPEIDAIFRLANKTIFTPFVGLGPGYEKWKREKDGKMFDDASSMTANLFGGLHIRLSKNFGIQAMRKRTLYLNDPPRQFDDHQKFEARDRITNEVGFSLSF